MDQTTPTGEYKPNIYPIMYWALLYGIIAASALLALHLLSGLITFIWFPVFLAGLVWGGFRKYKQDKAAWEQSQGNPAQPKTPVQEFKDAARDIAKAGSEMIARQAQEDKEVAQAVEEAQSESIQEEGVAQEATVVVEEPEEVAVEEETIVTQEPEESKPPQSPLQPLV